MSSGGLAPSKSTVYVSNLPFSLTNNDLHKIFEKYGRVAKVTIAKDKQTRQSKGVAFVLFIEKESAYKCVEQLHNTEMFKRTIKCSIAKDNGRAPEFIRRKVYKDKTKCYECGEEGHLSYECSHNLLGDREPPPKKEKKKRKQDGGAGEEGRIDFNYDSDDDTRDRVSAAVPPPDTLAAAILYQQQIEEEAGRQLIEFSGQDQMGGPQRKKYKKDSYFSDEEELD